MSFSAGGEDFGFGEEVGDAEFFAAIKRIEDEHDSQEHDAQSQNEDRPSSSSSSSKLSDNNSELLANLDRVNNRRPDLTEFGIERFLSNGEHPVSSRASRFEQMLRRTLTSVVNQATSPLKRIKGDPAASSSSVCSANRANASGTTSGKNITGLSGKTPRVTTPRSTTTPRNGATTPRAAAHHSAAPSASSSGAVARRGGTSTRNKTSIKARLGGVGACGGMNVTVTPRGGGMGMSGAQGTGSGGGPAPHTTAGQQHAARVLASTYGAMATKKSSCKSSHRGPDAATQQQQVAPGSPAKPMLLRKMTPLYNNNSPALASPSKIL